ncbi:MAG: hypothetical protein HYX34_02740 [Actinobacteria bacterium]|nr:hypothetical protein [Actinomycetota bacterium]
MRAAPDTHDRQPGEKLLARIWTNDNDFLGTGVATWTTETLQARLERS